ISLIVGISFARIGSNTTTKSPEPRKVVCDRHVIFIQTYQTKSTIFRITLHTQDTLDGIGLVQAIAVSHTCCRSEASPNSMCCWQLCLSNVHTRKYSQN